MSKLGSALTLPSTTSKPGQAQGTDTTTMVRPLKTSSTEPTPAELRAATTWVPKYEVYLNGCNISWGQRAHHDDDDDKAAAAAAGNFCFSWYMADFPAELARMLSEECHAQLPRRPILTADKEKHFLRPEVDLSRPRGGGGSGGQPPQPLILKQSLWHPADALEQLFDWFLRFSRGDRKVPAAPPGCVYTRFFHPVELVTYLKLQDAALFVGAHQFFIKALADKIAGFCTAAVNGARSSRATRRTLKAVLKKLDDEARQDLVETVASAILHRRLAAIPPAFKVDATLCGHIAEAVARVQLAHQQQLAKVRQLRKTKHQSTTTTTTTTTTTSSGSEGFGGPYTSSPSGIMVESSQTDVKAIDSREGPADARTGSLASFVDESILA